MCYILQHVIMLFIFLGRRVTYLYSLMHNNEIKHCLKNFIVLCLSAVTSSYKEIVEFPSNMFMPYLCFVKVMNTYK